MAEFFTGKRLSIVYGKETTYGTRVTTTSCDAWMGIPLGFDPTKNDLGHVDIEGLDAGTKDVNEILQTTERYGGTLRLRPQHGIPFAWAWNSDDISGLGTPSSSPDFHALADLASEDYDLNSMSMEVTDVHSTAASSHKEWYDGVKFNTLELRFDKGTPICELSIDIDAQDSDNANEATSVYETSLENLKQYYASALTPTLRPYMWSDVLVELQGTVFSDVVSGRVKIDNDLLADFVCNATVGRKISEPSPQRRKFEIELTARMQNSTYYDYWRNVTTLGSVSGQLDGAIVSNSATSIPIDNGAGGAQISNMPSIGIMKIDDGTNIEYVHFHDVDSATDAGAHDLTCVRGAYDSTRTVGTGEASFADGTAVTVYGGVTVILNKGTDALNTGQTASTGIDWDDDEDYLLFTGWDAKVTTFGHPRDIGGGILEQTFLIRPSKLVPTVVDSINKDYFATS